MKKMIAAAAAALTLAAAGSASAASILDLEGFEIGFGYPGAQIVDDGTGNQVLEITIQPGQKFIFLDAPGVQGIGTLPHFVLPVDEDLTDDLWPVVYSFDLKFPTSGLYKAGGISPAIVADKTVWYNDSYAYAFAQKVWIDNISYGYESNVGLVPEPSTWAMLIAGFGLVGSALRSVRNRTAQNRKVAWG